MISYRIPKDWLKHQLDVQGISQKRLAEALGIDASAASRLLGGQRRLKFDELPKLVRLVQPRSNEWTWDPDLYIEEQVKGRLEAALRIAGMTPDTFAALLGIETGQVHEAIAAGGGLQAPFAADAAQLLGVPQNYLQADNGMGDGPGAIHALAQRWGETVRYNHQHFMDRNARKTRENWDAGSFTSAGVRIYEAPKPLGGGLFAWSGRVVEHRSFTPLEGVADAWGMMLGDGGAPPRFQRGDILYVHPYRLVRPGDAAVARLGMRLALGTVSTDGTGLVDADGNFIRETRSEPLHKIVGVTFD